MVRASVPLRNSVAMARRCFVRRQYRSQREGILAYRDTSGLGNDQILRGNLEVYVLRYGADEGLDASLAGLRGFVLCSIPNRATKR